MVKKIDELPVNVAVVGPFTFGDLPNEPTQGDVEKRVFKGGSDHLASYIKYYEPAIKMTLSLPVVDGGKVVKKDHEIHLPFGGAMRRDAKPTDQGGALLESAAPDAIVIDICDGDAKARDKHPALAAALVADGLSMLLEPKGPFGELKFEEDGVNKARQMLELNDPSAGGALTVPVKRELVGDASPVRLPGMASTEDVSHALPRALGVAAHITVADLAKRRCQGLSNALDVIDGAGKNWSTTAEKAREQILDTLKEAVKAVTEQMQPLLKVWLTLALLVRATAQHNSEAQHKREPVATLDLPVKALLLKDDCTHMAGEDGRSFQKELFEKVVTSTTEVDQTPSVGMVVLAEPVSCLPELETVGRYAKDAWTMVFASLDPDKLASLRTCLESNPFDKDDETWKQHVSVFAPSVQIDGPDWTDTKISLPAAAAVVARLIEVQKDAAGPDDEAGGIAKNVVGARTPLLPKGSSMPGTAPSIIISDRALHQRVAKGLVTIIYCTKAFGMTVSDANTLFDSSDDAKAIYGVYTATILTNWLRRTILHHMNRKYEGQLATEDTRKNLEADIRALFNELDNGTKSSSRKIIVADQTTVSVELGGNSNELIVEILVGIPNILKIKTPPEVKAQTAKFNQKLDYIEGEWTPIN